MQVILIIDMCSDVISPGMSVQKKSHSNVYGKILKIYTVSLNKVNFYFSSLKVEYPLVEL